MQINAKEIKSIKVFGKTYAVKFVDGNDWSMNGADGRYSGRADHEAQQILVKERLSNESSLDTIIHEAVHAISVNLGMELSEAQITQWATAITDLFLSNEWRA